MAHAWFESYDWAGLVNMTKEPPWRPQLAAADDVQCFDDAASGDSLDGPLGKTHPEELLKRWDKLQQQYAGVHGLSDMSHLHQ